MRTRALSSKLCVSTHCASWLAPGIISVVVVLSAATAARSASGMLYVPLFVPVSLIFSGERLNKTTKNCTQKKAVSGLLVFPPLRYTPPCVFVCSTLTPQMNPRHPSPPNAPTSRKQRRRRSEVWPTVICDFYLFFCYNLSTNLSISIYIKKTHNQLYMDTLLKFHHQSSK